ncbi:autotransporter assembly complex family protein [Malonomonas rubra]|uniref:autotransporter assembly complex protein TamA n=1 Tax=Malonomonas rubra TaxID=57040 RepID=UPI0026EA56A5|nr:autotransporter assembly complex family protein [Malonomonas rubra]
MKSLIVLFSFLCLAVPLAQAATLSLEIETDPPELKKILQTALLLPAALTSEQQPNTRWLRYFQKQLPQRVAEILQPYGYFGSQIRSQLLHPTPEQHVLKVQVVAGEPIRITQLDLKFLGPGTKLEDIRELLQKFPLKLDDILRQDLYEQGKALLIEDVVEQGFLDAHFVVHQMRVHLEDYQAEITLHLATGPRYLFGPTTFPPDTGYPEYFLRRFLSHHEGEVFSHAELGQTQLNLIDADLFKTVTVTPIHSEARDESIPIAIDLQPAPRHQWRPGVGYGTDTGARVSLRYRDRNLFRNGHELRGDLLLAQNQQSLISSYIIPDPDRLDSQTQLRIGYDREESDSYLSRELFGEVEYQRALSKRLVGTLFLRLTQEYSEIGLEKTRSQMLLPGVRMQWRRAGSQPNRFTGLYGSFELKGAQDNLLSDTSLVQLSAQVNSRFPLRRTIFALIRLQGGTTWHDDPLRELPASLRFFAGGDRSVRGYGYKTLGPKDASGQVVGGNHLLIGNFELEKRLSDKWGSAIFYDIGNAFDSFAEYDLAQGTGIGILRYTPIGPIRLDLARQIGPDKPRLRLHLSMGFDW